MKGGQPQTRRSGGRTSQENKRRGERTDAVFVDLGRQQHRVRHHALRKAEQRRATRSEMLVTTSLRVDPDAKRIVRGGEKGTGNRGRGNKQSTPPSRLCETMSKWGEHRANQRAGRDGGGRALEQVALQNQGNNQNNHKASQIRRRQSTTSGFRSQQRGEMREEEQEGECADTAEKTLNGRKPRQEELPGAKQLDSNGPAAQGCRRRTWRGTSGSACGRLREVRHESSSRADHVSSSIGPERGSANHKTGSLQHVTARKNRNKVQSGDNRHGTYGRRPPGTANTSRARSLHTGVW